MATKDDSSDSQVEVLVHCVECGRLYAGPGLLGSSCPKCAGKLEEVGRARAEERPDEKTVEVFRATDWLQAEMIREHLQAEGLLVAFRSAMPWGVLTFTVDGLGEVGILALESDAERARALIEEYLQQVSGDADEDGDTEDEEDE